jgi:hypothetical protein
MGWEGRESRVGLGELGRAAAGWLPLASSWAERRFGRPDQFFLFSIYLFVYKMSFVTSI